MQTLHFVMRGRPVPVLLLSVAKVFTFTSRMLHPQFRKPIVDYSLECLKMVRRQTLSRIRRHCGLGEIGRSNVDAARRPACLPTARSTTQCTKRTAWPRTGELPPFSENCLNFTVAPMKYGLMEEDRRELRHLPHP